MTKRKRRKNIRPADRMASALIHGANRRAKKRGLRFTLFRYRKAIARRVAAGVCELSGVPFAYDRRMGPQSPSVHRVIPALGYSYRNIRLVCFGINAGLGSWSFGEAEHLMIEASRGTPDIRKKRARLVQILNRKLKKSKFLVEAAALLLR